MFMLRLCLVPSPSVLKLYSINLATLLLTHCSAWLRALGCRCQCPAINKRSQTIAAGERASQDRSNAPDRTSVFSTLPSGRVLSWSGVFAAAVELLGLLWPSSPASRRACCLRSRRASVWGLDKVPSGRWAAIADIVCILRPWRACREAGAGDFLNCCIIGLNSKWWSRRGKLFCISSFIPWALCFACIFLCSLRKNLFFLLLQDTDLFKGEILKANEVFPLRIVPCNC